MNSFIKIIAIVLVLFSQFSCKTYQDILPKTATIVVPAKGEIKLFESMNHNSFLINLKNLSTKNSCEAYTVKNGNKKWISPSLPVNGKLYFSVSSSSFVLLQNFSDENISVVYTID